VAGFVTRSVRDTALLMSVGAADESLLAAPDGSPDGLRVAVSMKPPFPARVHADVQRAVERTAERLRALGHAVQDADPPYPPVSPATTRYLAGIAQDADERVERPDRLQRRTKGFARMGRAIPKPVLDWARREDDSSRYEGFFREHDVLLTSVNALPSWRAGHWEGLGAVRTFLGMVQAQPALAGEWNLTGQPAISVPGGTSEDGMPIGVMIVGRHNEEATLIALAAQLEEELRWTDRRPPLS
jgi:amidase